MQISKTIKQITDFVGNVTLGVWHSFPVQLLLMHFRNNPLLLAIWVFLATAAAGEFGETLWRYARFIRPRIFGNRRFLEFLLVRNGV